MFELTFSSFWINAFFLNEYREKKENSINNISRNEQVKFFSV